MFSKATTLLALAASVTAHMTIENPVPFGKATLNSSPLGPGDFPCKQRSGVYDITQMNQWNAGETQVVSFKGSAVHGGGSCQFSLTTDPEPTEKSQWKVIQSVMGGCPSNVTGNLPSGSPDDLGAATFPVQMPADMPDGRYTFAWTWINKVGNREFYMNCAPVQVGKPSGSGTASTKSAASILSKLPDMFVANLPATQCSTAENEDFVYPNPGQNVVEGNGAALGDTLTGAGCSTQTKMGAGNGQMGSPSQPDTPTQPKPSQKPSTPSKAPEAPSNPGGVFAPGASSAPASGPTAPAAAPAKPVPTQGGAPKSPDNSNNAPAAPSAPSAPSTPSNNNGQCVPCTNDGAVVCIGSKQFGLCNRGCAVPQDVALGMACANGVVGAAVKRSFPRAHLHRRHGSSVFA